jgi:hypothetical protein
MFSVALGDPRKHCAKYLRMWCPVTGQVEALAPLLNRYLSCMGHISKAASAACQGEQC